MGSDQYMAYCLEEGIHLFWPGKLLISVSASGSSVMKIGYINMFLRDV